MRNFVYFLWLITFIWVWEADTTMYEEVEINPDFILRSDLMPSSLLMIDGEGTENNGFSSVEHLQIKENDRSVSFNGSWFDAYNTMGFHRKMFNEYLCRNYVVKEILSEMQTPVLSRRVGRPFIKLNDKEKENHQLPGKRKSRTEYNDLNEDLLSDPGSSNYRNWLSKTSTLEDVYRHYDMAVTRDTESEDREDTSLDYETGDFTGYAVPGTPNAAGKNDYQPPADNYYSNYPPAPPIYPPPSPMYPLSMQDDDTDKHDGYGFHPHHVHFHSSESEKSHSHGLQLNDIFDIALTTIAFLSFGMFILQVIMCITMNKPMMTMMSMTDVETEPAEVIDELRFRRHAPSMESHPFNELAKRILVSIETELSANEDKGSCLRWSLCENNKYSRSLDNKQKFWIPVWGLGMSWLSSRFIQGSHTTSVMLESLRACALGLAQIDCSFMYPACDLKHLLKSRRNSTRWKIPPSSRE